MKTKRCAWCERPLTGDLRKRYCDTKCWGKARAAANREGSVEPPPIAGAAWLPLADGRWALVDVLRHHTKTQAT